MALVAIGKQGAVVRQLRVLFDVGTIGELTDGQLLERFATGGGEASELAFAALIERHGPMVARVCRGVLCDPHDCQDAFQATFFVLLKKARGLWVRDSLGPWLHQVAFRTASCARTAAARRHRHELGAAVLRTEAHVEAHDDLARVLHEEIERLPERFRAPLVLCDLEGSSHEQAARHLGWPVGTVKSRQARGRERLRERLRRRGVASHATVLAAASKSVGASGLVSPALVDSTMKAAIQFVSFRTFVPGTATTLAHGVLSSMYLTQWLKVLSVLLVLGVTTSGVGLLAQKESGVAVAGPGERNRGVRADEVPATAVKPGKLSVTVIEKGYLEASRPAVMYSRIEGSTKIIQILPEGTEVKKGQTICKLDSAALKDQLVNQTITAQNAEANFKRARLTREVAELAVVEYREGIYKQDLGMLKNAVTAAQSAIEKAESRMKRAQIARKRVHDTLAAKGAASSPADIVAELDIEDRLESAELTLLRERMTLEQAKSKQNLLESVTLPRTTRELKNEVERLRMAELAAMAAWELEGAKGKKLERQIAACTLTAPKDGSLVHANDASRLPGQPSIIREGSVVRERQRICTVIDGADPMQVNTKVHESQVDRLSINMKAKIRVDAFPDELLDGTVLEIAPLPDSTNFFSANIKVYTTKVKIDQRLRGLKPGMTARVEILVAERDNVLSVPVEAIVQYGNKDHVAVKKPDGGIEWRDVTLGMSDEKIVEVKQGIKSGDVVVARPLDLLNTPQRRSSTPPAAQTTSPQ